MADMIATLHRASEMLALRVRVRDNVERARGQYDFGKVVTQNQATRRMLEVAHKAAESEHTTIPIQGESGTGKGVFARAIHYASPRATMPLLELNCAALPETLSLELSREITEGSETTAPNGRKLVSLREVEDQYVQQVLVATGNNKTQAARILGIHPTSLLRRLKKDSS
jgi:transcriptional regulator with PAS, ATPase and Fis domain